MSLAKLAEKKKAEAEGKKRGKSSGPVDSPSEFMMEAQKMVENQGPEFSANLAKIAVTDMGAYTSTMETLKEQVGPAAMDLLHAEVMKRVTKFQKSAKDEKPQIEATPEELKDKIMAQLAATVGATPEEAKQAELQAELEGPTIEEREAEQQAAAEQTAQSLVQEMGPAPGVPSDKVPIKVDGEALAKTESAGADGMVQDGLVYLHPDEYNPSTSEGQRLVAEETIHFVQQQHALTGAGAEISPMPAVEREAQDLADRFAAGEAVEPPQEVMGPNDIATSGGAAEPERTDIVKLNFGGMEVEVDVPTAAGTTLAINLSESPIPGLNLNGGTIELDESANLAGGTVNASLSVGSFVSMDNIELAIDASGAVQCTIEGANLSIGDIANGTMDLQLSSEGISGTATVNHEQTTLPMGIVLLDGFFRVTLLDGGSVAAVGNFSFELPGLGICALNLSLDNETIGGTATLAMENPIPLGAGTTLKEAQLSGNYTRDGFRISGSALVNVNEWAEGSIMGSYEFPTMTWSAGGTLSQLQPLELGPVTLSEGQLAIALENGSLTEVGGGGKITYDKFEGSLGGTYDVAASSFDGEATVNLMEDISLGSAVHIMAGSGGKAQVVGNQLESLSGTLNAEIESGGKRLVRAEAEGEYNITEGKLVSLEGTASLLEPIELLGGKVKLTAATGHAKIENNELVAAGGDADVEIDGFKGVEGKLAFEWSKQGGQDEYTGSGELNVQFTDDLGGTVKVELKPGGEFSISGEIEYQINEMLKGMIGIQVGNDLNPILNGRMELTGVELIPARDLFGMDIDVLPPVTIGSFYGLNLVLGASAGMKASIQAVTFDAAIEVENFKPLEMNMPEFQVEAGLNAGLDFSAGIRPFIGVSGGVAGCQAGLGVEGELKLNVPITASPKLILRGGPDGYSGELKIGVKITPSLDLIVRPFVFAELGEMFKHHITEWSIPLGEIFNWEWNKTYPFGDQGTGASDGGADVTEDAPSSGEQTYEEGQEGPLSGYEASGGGMSQGGPDLDSGGDLAMGAGGEGGSELSQKMEEVKELAEKIANVAYLVSTIMDLVAIAMIAPPWGLAMIPAYVCYRIWIKGDLDLGQLKQGVTDLFDLIQEAFAWILENLPQWLKDLYEWITSGGENVLNEMTGWLSENLQELGQEAVDFFKDAGDWGEEVIKNAGDWAIEAAGWAMEALSDAGEAIADKASDVWDWLTG